MFCYGPDIAQLEACWLSVKRALQEKVIYGNDEAVQMFVKAFQDHHTIWECHLPHAKARWNAALFVTLIRNLLPKGSEESTCESMYEIFEDVEWVLYLKLVDGLEMEEHLRDCLCQLEEEIYLDILKLILDVCQKDADLKVSRLANPVLASIFIRYPTLKPAKRYCQIISSAALWLLEITPENCKNFSTHYKCFVETATAFSVMLLKVISDNLHERVGDNYKVGEIPKIKNLVPFTSAKHWIYMARLFHNYICPHRWHYLGLYSDKIQSVRFLMRCVTLFDIEIFHPMKKPKLMRAFKRRDLSGRCMGVNLQEEEKDIDDHLESLEECLKESKTEDKKVLYLKTYVSRHVVYQVMKKLLTICTQANEGSRKTISLHFLNMCEQSLLPHDVILELYLDICKGTELLKQPEYTQEITTFLNQAAESHEVQELIPPMVQLCLQSPKNVVHNVICRALESKGHIPTLVKLLCEVSLICRFKDNANTSCLLTSCLKSFTKQDLIPKQAENLNYFVQELIKHNSTKNTLDVSEFTSDVIVSLLNPETNLNATELPCQLLHTVLDSSPAKLSCDVTALAVTLAHLANRSINSSELAKADKFFSLLQKVKDHLPANFSAPEELKDFHPLLRIKTADIFHLSLNDQSILEINNLERALIQSTCFQNEEPALMATKHLNSLNHTVRYAALVAALSKVLPVISQADWVPVLQLINVLLANIHEQEHKSSEEQCSTTVLMFRATTDALVVHHKKGVSTNWSYVLSAYAVAIKDFSPNLGNSEHVSYAFCEVCRLANALPQENSQCLLVGLMHLTGLASSCTEKNLIVMLRVAINGLSSGKVKEALLTHLKSVLEE